MNTEQERADFEACRLASEFERNVASYVEPAKQPSDTELVEFLREINDEILVTGPNILPYIDKLRLCCAVLERYGQSDQDAARWRKARTLPRSWWRDAFNRIAAEGVTLDDLIDAETRRKLP